MDRRVSPAEGVRITTAHAEEWATVRAVRLAALADSPDAFSDTLAAEEAKPASVWRERLSRDTHVSLLAWVDEGSDARPVGLAVVGPAFGHPEAAGLFALWVDPSARGLGVGDALIRAAVGRARQAGHPHLYLDVGDHNEAAIRLYERHGFVPTGHTWRHEPPREHLVEHERVLQLQP